ncbi:hypothetical protein D9619_006868 [Psilocybe cf. subviscida]|uniref:Uncharacterized protein n=1 Tax=Psilocybe cf. subviscida TaxID=2480587 RepID=A0A8H5B587_9AGAR|nr:hypothetical protein D9619_006868 [Psilocybe cf. subviscida]
MSPAQTHFIIADYRYLVVSSTLSDIPPSRRLHLVHHRRVLYMPRQQSSPQTPTPTSSTETETETCLDTGLEPASDNSTCVEQLEGEHWAELLKLQTRRPRPNRWNPYPSAMDRMAVAGAVARQIKKHTSTPVLSSGPSILQVKEVDIGAEVARNYERRAQRMRASVKLYPDDDEGTGRTGKEEIYSQGNFHNDTEEDHPYNPAHATATANYLRCIQWLRNIPLYAPPDA